MLYLRGMYKVCSCLVRIRNLETEEFTDKEGEGHGSVLSPFSFTNDYGESNHESRLQSKTEI